MNNLSLKGKVAWITGGKRVGQAIAVALAREGVNLVISYKSSEKEAQEIVEKVREFGVRTLVLQADVSNRESVLEAVAEIKKAFGTLDLLILLASIFKPVKLEDIDERAWQANFSAHVLGTFWPVQLSLPLMAPGSHIVTVADRTTLGKIYPGYVPYVVTKAAVGTLTRALGVELGPKGIFINSIAPGPVLKPDDITAEEWQGIRNASVISHPLTDEEAVEEFVQTVLRLCHVRSSGSIYPLDFGHL